MPRSSVHQDLNDNNVVCDAQGRVTGVIDFGDMSLTETCNNLAVALAYAFFGRPKPLEVLEEAVALPPTLPSPHALRCYTLPHTLPPSLPSHTVSCLLAHHPVPCYRPLGARLLRGTCDLPGGAARALSSGVHARVHHRGHVDTLQP